MANNQTLTAYQGTTSPLVTAKSAEISLITLERAQKLDLLIHLLANLSQSLVICGPKGIGKTTLLAELKQRKGEVWPLLTIKASSNLSFESIQEQIVKFAQQSDEAFKNQEFSAILSALDKQNQKLVIIIEAAGQLVPGLISTLIQYASTSQSIRIVFSLTHDELHLKISSDKAIDDCHFIEMPPLSQSQCALFLQHLSRQPKAIVPFHAINERMIASLYQKTHGIPGKIMSELPDLSNYSAGGGLSWGILVFLAIMVTTGIGFFMLNDTNEAITINGVQTKKSLLLPKAEVVEIFPPIVRQEIEIKIDKLAVEQIKKERKSVAVVSVEKEIDRVIGHAIVKKPRLENQLDNKEIQVTESNEAIVPTLKPKENIKTDVVEKIVINKLELAKKTDDIIPPEKPVAIVKDKKTAKVHVPKKEPTTSGEIKDDRLWILAQAKKQYTIQLMVLSNRQAVLEFLKKNSDLKKELRYFRKGEQGKRLFVLIYGAYKNHVTASNKMESLPVEFRKSWVRNFAILQKSINNEQ